jgi:hypothetical protein
VELATASQAQLINSFYFVWGLSCCSTYTVQLECLRDEHGVCKADYDDLDLELVGVCSSSPGPGLATASLARKNRLLNEAPSALRQNATKTNYTKGGAVVGLLRHHKPPPQPLIAKRGPGSLLIPDLG